MALPLPLRNRLAALILDAFEDASARATLRALERVGATGAAGTTEDADRLIALGWFEPAGPGRARLRDAHREHRAALAARAGRGTRATGDWREPPGEPLARLLARAAALAEERLFFELHELLEPAWLGAEEPLRTALQGLIQVAVAFHHLDHGNREGARSLLGDGRAKLAVTAGALPVDAGEWLVALGAAHDALVRGREPGPIPPWPGSAVASPAPTADRPPPPPAREDRAWRCS